MNTSSTTRQYGAAIALVSGVYSLLSATAGSGMMSSNSGLLMALLGVVLLTPYSSQLGNASGPLMIGYSLVMLLNQALVGVTGSMNWGMEGGMGTGMDSGMSGGMVSSMTAGMGWDLGMIALAILMLFSGIIMTNHLDNKSGM